MKMTTETRGWRVLVLAGSDTTEWLHGGRVYVSRRAAHRAADRAVRVPIETVPTGYTYPAASDARGWDDLRTYGYPAPRSEEVQR